MWSSAVGAHLPPGFARRRSNTFLLTPVVQNAQPVGVTAALLSPPHEERHIRLDEEIKSFSPPQLSLYHRHVLVLLLQLH